MVAARATVTAAASTPRRPSDVTGLSITTSLSNSAAGYRLVRRHAAAQGALVYRQAPLPALDALAHTE